jgi:hypothetical protein
MTVNLCRRFLLISALLHFTASPCAIAEPTEACSSSEGCAALDLQLPTELELSLLQTDLAVRERQHAKTTVHEWLGKSHANQSELQKILQHMDLKHMDMYHMALYIGAGLGILLVCSAVAVYSGSLNTAGKGSEATKAGHEDGISGNEVSRSGDAAGGEGLEKPKLWMVLVFVLGHSISASSLTVVNKVAMNRFHPPPPETSPDGLPTHGYLWTLVLLQFLFAAFVAKAAGLMGLIKVEPLQLRPAMAYFPAAGMFMITIVAGNAVMNLTNVNTFLILRSIVPVPCALLETGLYSDPLPPRMSWVALAVTTAGAVLYVRQIGGFEMNSIAWSAMFLVTMPIDGILIKHSISMSKLSAWGLVYYNNVLASLPLIVYVFMFELPNKEKFQDMLAALSVPGAQTAVLASCVAGVCISFFQLNTRFYISATAFMILGVINKFLTVLWSEVFLGGNSACAIIGILMCLGGAVCWQMIMGQASVKLRARTASWESRALLPFGLTIIALAWAAWIQHTTT